MSTAVGSRLTDRPIDADCVTRSAGNGALDAQSQRRHLSGVVHYFDAGLPRILPEHPGSAGGAALAGASSRYSRDGAAGAREVHGARRFSGVRRLAARPVVYDAPAWEKVLGANRANEILDAAASAIDALPEQTTESVDAALGWCALDTLIVDPVLALR